MKAYIICCNDGTEAVVLKNRKSAQLVLEEFSKRDFDTRKFDYHTYEEYRKIFYWHLHTVEVIEEMKLEEKPMGQFSWTTILDAIVPEGMPPLPKHIRMAQRVWRKYKEVEIKQLSVRAEPDMITLVDPLSSRKQIRKVTAGLDNFFSKWNKLIRRM